MIDKRKKLMYTIISMIVFWIAGVMSIWKCIAKEPTLLTMIPAICFPLAAIGMTISAFRLYRSQKMNEEIKQEVESNIMDSMIFVVVFAILGVIIQLLLVRWVVQDAEKRGLNQILWGLIVFCTSFIGLCIYVWCKPKFPVKQS